MPVTVSLSDLLTTYTEDDLLDVHLEVLKSASFPTTSWAPTSVPYVLTKSNSRAVLDLANLVPQIAAGGLLSTATTGWLTLLASSNYEVDRIPAVHTQRVLRLTNNSLSSVDVDAGEVWVLSAEGLRYNNTTGGTIAAAAGSTIDLVFQAEESGADYDALTASWTLSTSLPGVTVTEPVVSIIQSGADEESDDALRARCYEKWSTLGAGANDSAYKYWAKNTPGVTETITRVQVQESTPLPGQVTLTLATATGAVSSSYDFGTVSLSGTGPSGVTTSAASGYTEPQESFSGRAIITLGGARGTAEFKLSTDGGVTYGDAIVTAATYDISDTGVRLNFPVGTYVLNDLYSWTTTASTVTLVQNYIDPSDHLGVSPNCVDVIVQAATEYTLTPVGTITVSSASYKAAVEAARAATLLAFTQHVDTGGVIRVSEIIERYMGLAGVIDISLSTPAANVSLSAGVVCVAGSIAGLTVSVL